MPELPDLAYIEKKLVQVIPGKTITSVSVKNPIVLRILTKNNPEEILINQKFESIKRHGPFLKLELTNYEIIIHFMLVGKLQYIPNGAKSIKSICLSLFLENGYTLHYADEKQMGKIYLVNKGEYEKINSYNDLGIDIMSSNFTFEAFNDLISKKRQQIRALLIDNKIINTIGNAYADEILFNAKIYPKTPSNKLDSQQKKALYESIRNTMQWGIDEVEKAGKPIEAKVREHMRIRNKKNQPCPICGEKIRRTTIYGFDTFFCPKCQPSSDNTSFLW